MTDDYKVQLDSYNGPLDLLLFLIRREEVNIYDIPLARITEQYVAYVELLEKLDPDHVGEFLVMAATLMEIKSRTLLPSPPPEEVEEDFVDPRLELVRQLLEYKRFKDVARDLGEAAEVRAQRFGRLPVPPKMDVEPELDLDSVQVWDLVSAFGKLLTQIGIAGHKHEVVYDDTPIALHAADIIDRLQRDGPTMRFEEVFAGRQKGEIIGLFLALLELLKNRRLRVEQAEGIDSILLHLIDSSPLLDSELEAPEVSTESPDPEGQD